MKIIIMFFIISYNLLAQTIKPEVFSIDGNNFIGKDFQLSWTIGEPIVETISDNNIIVTQGFHQTYKKEINVDEENKQDFYIQCIPNPISDKAKLIISSKYKAKGNMIITNLLGQEVLKILKINLDNEGNFFLDFDARKLPNGVYNCTIYFEFQTTNIILIINK